MPKNSETFRKRVWLAGYTNLEKLRYKFVRNDSADTKMAVSAAPANDEIINSRAINSSSLSQNNFGATVSAGEDVSVEPGFDAPTGNTVWFSYTAQVDGPVTIDTNGSDFDTTLQAYSLTNPAAGPAYNNLIELDSNDDNGNGGNPTEVAFLASTVTFNATAGQTYYIQAGGRGDDVGGFEQGNLVVNASPVPCFVTGTLIATDHGGVAVEDLRVGDLVVTASDEQRLIRWIGHRSLDCGRHPRPEAVWPVRVLAGAFGADLPKRDLWLSPDHAVRVSVLDAVLIPIKHLINDATIAQIETDTVTYWHVELDSHDILLAEGLPAESFLDTGVRAGFENAGEHLVLHPDFAPLSLDDFCLPLVQDGPIVDAVRTRLLARASAMGWSLTAEDGLHLLADGIVVQPERDGAVARFTIPADTVEVRLVSRSFVPERVKVGAGDGRRLGVPLRGLSVLDGAGIVRSLPIDHPLMSDGYSFVQEEAGDRWRWTDGDACIAPALWAGAPTAVTLRVETAPDRGTLQAWQAPGPVTEESAGFAGDLQAA